MIYTVSNGSGGSPNVLIKTETGATVTLSKGDVVLKKIAENGEALFESVEYGTWTAVATLDDNTATQQIEVPQTIEQEVNLGLMLSSLPLKTTKLKIGGIKWILFARDHAGYPSGAQTLISEFILQNSSFGSTVNYIDSTVKSLCEQKYQAFSENEKQYVLETTRKIKNGSSQYPDITEHVFIMNSTEVGGNSDGQMGSNLGFSSNAERICTTTSGSAQYWWLADAYSSTNVWNVGSDGSLYDAGRPSGDIGVRPAMNLSQNTILNEYPDDEGYYTIYHKVETANALIVGDKVKINGIKHTVIAKNNANYGNNTVTLFTDDGVQTSVFNTVVLDPAYSTSVIKSVAQNYYDLCSQAEKNAIIQTIRSVSEYSGLVQSTEHYFVPTFTEMGGTPVSGEPSSLFTTNDERSINKVYWTASYRSTTTVCCINTNGSFTYADLNDSYYVRLMCNLSSTAPMNGMDGEGYYTIKGADTISTLKDKSLEILGVKL